MTSLVVTLGRGEGASLPMTLDVGGQLPVDGAGNPVDLRLS